ncbi:MAG TPA: hypothetical protein VHY37_01735, partial [Tepidisphaeraceae bacterium]|nr:hypothetical protein [Tepidisphaeraceae bacterium]
MADDSLILRRIDWREVFPFTNLFRAFRVAVHPSKLALGLLLLILLYCGGRVLDCCWPRHSQAIWGEVGHYEADLWGEPTAVDYSSPGAGYKFNNTLGSDITIAADINPGMTSAASFDQWRDAQAKDYRDQYAAMLIASGLVTDPHAASDAADRGEYFDQLERQIIARRNAKFDDIKDTFRKAVAAADALPNPDDRERAKHDAARARDADEQQAEAQCDADTHHLRTLVPHGLFTEFFDYEVRQVDYVVNGVLAWNWIGGFHPAGAVGPQNVTASPGVIHAIGNFIIVGPAWLLSKHWLFFTIMLVWFLLLWAIFGGAICRITAVHVARDEKISVRQALSFSFNKILSFIFAPVIPLLIVLFLGLLVGVGGLLFYVPYLGPIAAGVFFGLALLVGGVMTVVSLGTIAGFNLMYPTVSVEGSDSFDAISRSFSYVFARPWRMLWYTFVTLIYGAFCFLFVRYFIFVLLGVTHFFVSWFLAGQPGRFFPQIWPGSSPTDLTYPLNFAQLKWSEGVSAFLIAVWVYITIGLLGAYVISFYFSANTIIYYLMRREVDATELDDVYVEETDEDFADRPASTPAAPEGATGVVSETVVVVQPEPPPPPPEPPASP